MSSFGRAIARGGLAALQLAQFHRLLTPVAGGLGLVLMTHRIRPRRSVAFRPNGRFEVTPDFLSKAVGRLRRRGIETVSLDEALRRTREPGGGRFAVLTIDGAYRDTLEHGYPMLKALACPFSVFVATGTVDREVAPWWRVLEEVVAKQETVAVSFDGPVSYFDCRGVRAKYRAFGELQSWLLELDEERMHEAVGELAWRYGVDTRQLVDAEMMDWDQLRRLAADPLVTIGAQTTGYPFLSKLPGDRVRAEIRDGAKVLDVAIGTAPRHFAYPYGTAAAAGPREYEMVGELGFSVGLTAVRGMVRPRHGRNPTAWPRVVLDGRVPSLAYLDMLSAGLPIRFAAGS